MFISPQHGSVFSNERQGQNQLNPCKSNEGPAVQRCQPGDGWWSSSGFSLAVVLGHRPVPSALGLCSLGLSI